MCEQDGLKTFLDKQKHFISKVTGFQQPNTRFWPSELVVYFIFSTETSNKTVKGKNSIPHYSSTYKQTSFTHKYKYFWCTSPPEQPPLNKTVLFLNRNTYLDERLRI